MLCSTLLLLWNFSKIPLSASKKLFSSVKDSVSEILTKNKAREAKRKGLADDYWKTSDLESKIKFLKEHTKNLKNLNFLYNKLWKEWFNKLILSFTEEEMLGCTVFLNKYSIPQLDELINHIYSDDMLISL